MPVDVERQPGEALVVLPDRGAKAGVLLPHAVGHRRARRAVSDGGRGRGAAGQQTEGEDQAAESDRGSRGVGAHRVTGLGRETRS